jgi:hypothetical protein
VAEVGFKTLLGLVRDMKAYEIALLEGKAITETDLKDLNDEAFVLVDGIAGAALEARRRLAREIKRNETLQRRAQPMTKSIFEKLAKQLMLARPPPRRNLITPNAVGARKGASRGQEYPAILRGHRLTWLKMLALFTACQCEIIQGRLAGKLLEPSLLRLAMRDDFPEQQAHPAPCEDLSDESERGAWALRSLAAWA